MLNVSMISLARKLINRRAKADFFAELRPFYLVCLIGTALTAFNLFLLLWIIFPPPLRGVLVLGGVTAIALSEFLWRRARSWELGQVDQNLLRERPLRRQQLEACRSHLRSLVGNSARLVIEADPGTSMWTVRGGKTPIVKMAVGFWANYQDSPDEIDAVLAHEAGHIVAGDVEIFSRLKLWLRLVALLAVLTVVAVLVACRAQLNDWTIEARDELLYALIRAIGTGIGIALVWSALLIAREIQADAYAAIVLGQETSIRAALQRQLLLRKQRPVWRSPWRILRQWMIQPSLRWRLGMPALRGSRGTRLDLILGISMSAFLTSARGTPTVAHDFGLSAFDDVLMLVISPLFLLYIWITYRFLWGRNQALIESAPAQFLGRIRGVLKSLGSCFLYAVPPSAMEHLFPLFARSALNLNLRYFGYSLSEAPFHQETTRWPLMATWPALILMIWTASGIALLSPSERTRERPSFWRAAAIGVIYWLPFRRTYLMLGFSDEVLIAGALLTGVVAHIVATRASKRRWYDTGSKVTEEAEAGIFADELRSVLNRGAPNEAELTPFYLHQLRLGMAGFTRPTSEATRPAALVGPMLLNILIYIARNVQQPFRTHDAEVRTKQETVAALADLDWDPAKSLEIADLIWEAGVRAGDRISGLRRAPASPGSV